ncbi:hypothetical protein C2857_005741 [Epichloe festucae Fl1]|uniref:Peptidase A1 domain-containing protein n=1 Tax=Epichloe festucae (strain Fl1) TaxID=877507 RepID=A0A7S9KL60_EPIFF|nr:hypothetical protein C2857_005741 [Epichloe festucae Fl1]
MAQACVPTPLALPIKNVTLASGKTQRGVLLTVAEPEQSFAFLPNWGVNNTFLYGPQCDALDLAGGGDSCVTFRGGIYKPVDSMTKGTPPPDLKSPTDPWSSKTYKLLTDTFKVASNVSLKNFVFANPVDYRAWDLQGYEPLNMIGMDRGSTLMSTLRSTGHIASSAFGFWWGLDGTEDGDQQQGSLVLGGYDKAKTHGDGTSVLMSYRTDCSTNMMVTIGDITMNLSNGTDISIFEKLNGGTAMLACILPERASVMDMPRTPYFDNLLRVLGHYEADRSTGIDWWNVILDRTSVIYAGGMTFKLEGGLSVKIPNHQLVVPERKIDKEGSRYVNASRPVIRINSLQATTAKVLPILGRYFLTGAYLMGNPSAGRFTLWQANPTSDQILVAVNDKNEVFDPSKLCATTPTASLTTNSPVATAADRPPGDIVNPRLSPGSIAGIAIGSAVVVVACSCLLWFILRKRRSANQEKANGSHKVEHVTQQPEPQSELSTTGSSSASQVEGAAAAEGKSPSLMDMLVRGSRAKPHVTNEHCYFYELRQRSRVCGQLLVDVQTLLRQSNYREYLRVERWVPLPVKGLSDQLFDPPRSLYYLSFLSEVLKSMWEDAVEVIGACAWAVSDNWESGDFAPQIGLQVVNRTTQ